MSATATRPSLADVQPDGFFTRRLAADSASLSSSPSWLPKTRLRSTAMTRLFSRSLWTVA